MTLFLRTFVFRNVSDVRYAHHQSAGLLIRGGAGKVLAKIVDSVAEILQTYWIILFFWEKGLGSCKSVEIL